jgi:hypothetical protein
VRADEAFQEDSATPSHKREVGVTPRRSKREREIRESAFDKNELREKLKNIKQAVTPLGCVLLRNQHQQEKTAISLDNASAKTPDWRLAPSPIIWFQKVECSTWMEAPASKMDARKWSAADREPISWQT